MNVLLVTYSFPPAAGVGVLRALSLAKYLPENGVRLDVLTARNAAAVGQDARPLAQLSPEVAIHRTWTPDLPFALRKAIKKLISRAPAHTAPSGQPSSSSAVAPRPNRLKQFVANLLLPDPQVGWLPFASRAARRIIRERNIDLVLITVPPFSTVKLATRLRRRFPALPIVIDFRDEWLTTTIDLVSFNKNERARQVAHTVESEAVRDASAVVLVTEAAATELRTRYPEQQAGKFHCIPNGFDTASPAHDKAAVGLTPESCRDAGGVESAPAEDGTRTTLTYIGTVYGSTDPTPVVEAILSLPSEVASGLRLRFIGHIETAALRETLLRVNDAGAELELIGFLPQAEALAYIARTDYLLLITHDPINVAAKLYDYLGSGRPILAAVHPNGDVRRILNRTRAGWSASIDDPTAIAGLLTEAVQRAPELTRQFQPDREAIAAYHRRPITARYAALLREIAGDRPASGDAACAPAERTHS